MTTVFCRTQALVFVSLVGVMMTPALAVDGEVKTVGKVPSTDEVKKILSS